MQVDVWWVDMDSPEWDDAVCEAALTPEEIQACNRLVFARGRHHKRVSRWAARQILGSYLGLPAGEVAWNVDPQGKPFVPGPLSFNLSHSGRYAVLAVTREPGVQLGVDVEDRSRHVSHMQLGKRFFAAAEAQVLEQSAHVPETFFSIWTLKEAYVKALGSGLRHPLDEFLVCGRGGETPLMLPPEVEDHYKCGRGGETPRLAPPEVEDHNKCGRGGEPPLMLPPEVEDHNKDGPLRWGLFDLTGRPLEGWSAGPLPAPHPDYTAALCLDRAELPTTVERHLRPPGACHVEGEPSG